MNPAETARHAARGRLLNAYLRESGVHEVPTGEFSVRLPATGRVLSVRVTHSCTTGQHGYLAKTSPEHDEFVAALLGELAATTGHHACLAAQVNESITRTTRYLEHGHPAVPSGDPAALSRHAEHSVLFGHPFHPTPKSSRGFSEADLETFAPELGAEFQLHWWAVSRELVSEERVAPGPWVPYDVAARVPDGYSALPAHPWQERYLLRSTEVSPLLATGKVVPLGSLGPSVYPTSSVRTVRAAGFPTSWKLPLHVRITNFVRTNPTEHLHRASAASVLAGQLPIPAGLRVQRETGFRTLDPSVVGEELAAEFGVSFRENPSPDEAPLVLAGLLEHPTLLRDCVAQVGDTAGWLRRYLEISLVPLLALYANHGVTFEPHVQNSLVCLDNGWPLRFWVRDLEGAAVSRDRSHLDLPGYGKALRYDEAEVWQRLCYHAVTNHLGHLVHVLSGLSGLSGTPEDELWRLARDILRGKPGAAALLSSPTLPAKANLSSMFTGRAERPSYVDIPNPLRER